MGDNKKGGVGRAVYDQIRARAFAVLEDPAVGEATKARLLMALKGTPQQRNRQRIPHKSHNLEGRGMILAFFIASENPNPTTT